MLELGSQWDVHMDRPFWSSVPFRLDFASRHFCEKIQRMNAEEAAMGKVLKKQFPEKVYATPEIPRTRIPAAGYARCMHLQVILAEGS